MTMVTTTFGFFHDQWRIQDFPEGPQPVRWGHQPLIWPNFPTDCLKMKEIEPPPHRPANNDTLNLVNTVKLFLKNLKYSDSIWIHFRSETKLSSRTSRSKHFSAHLIAGNVKITFLNKNELHQIYFKLHNKLKYSLK